MKKSRYNNIIPTLGEKTLTKCLDSINNGSTLPK